MIPLGVLAASAVIAVPVMLASDSFNRANGALNGSSTDSAYGGTARTWYNSASMSVTSNQLRCTYAADRSASIPVSESDVSVSATVATVPTSGVVRLCARGSSTNFTQNRWSATVGSGGELGLGVALTGGLVELGYAPDGTVSAGDVVTLRCKGSNISVLVNGVTVLSAIDTRQPTGGYVGVFSTHTSWRLDDFKVETAP